MSDSNKKRVLRLSRNVQSRRSGWNDWNGDKAVAKNVNFLVKQRAWVEAHYSLLDNLTRFENLQGSINFNNPVRGGERGVIFGCYLLLPACPCPGIACLLAPASLHSLCKQPQFEPTRRRSALFARPSSGSTVRCMVNVWWMYGGCMVKSWVIQAKDNAT